MRNSITLILLLSTYFQVFAQINSDDTIYFDKNWTKTSEKIEAKYYRLSIKENNLYRFTDYYISGIVQCEGFFSNIDSEFKTGNWKYYTEEGWIESEGAYKENKRNGLWKIYREGKIHIESEIEDGVNEGNLTLYYPDGKIRSKEFYKNDKAFFGKTYDKTGKEITYVPVEEMPEFPGGEEALLEYIAKNTKYPKKAQKKDIQGTVLVNFIVEVDGSVTRAKIIKSVNPMLDAEAIRVVKSLPKWKPGTQDGIPVKVYYDIPFNFQMEE